MESNELLQISMDGYPILQKIEDIINQNGPEEKDYAFLDQFCQEYPEKLNELKSLDFMQSKYSIMGHVRHKPYGYAGDFHIIDRIYTDSAYPKFQKWDKYALQNAAAKAVRNRKGYFKRMLRSLSAAVKDISVLNIGSGPARDLYEFFEEEDALSMKITCIDMDPKSITYAKALNHEYLDYICFVNQNVLRLKLENKYDLIWSAGLFDYFSDKTFVHVLERLHNGLAEGGEIILGNFNATYNPSRHFMEVVGEWFLNHRTSEELMGLARKAGFDNFDISTNFEEENVNLFLHIKHKR